ncbi:MAG TPA: hypothetical protein VHS32_20065, partial [Streptosporangiaceae bacterium]|nr:hypothetical protein [Streptosporangiaceae bacterium]
VVIQLLALLLHTDRATGPGPNPGNASPSSTTRTAWPACWTGCGRQARTSRPPRLTARLPAAGMSGLFLEQKGAADQSRSGREADGTPAAPWRWEDLEVCGTSHSQLLQPEMSLSMATNPAPAGAQHAPRGHRPILILITC